MILSARQKAFFLIALKERPDDTEALFSYLPVDEAKAYAGIYKDLKGKKNEDIVAVAGTELKKLARPQNLGYLSEVHDDWLLEILKDELPGIIATVLRYLPAERVKFLLDHLPKDVLACLPSLIETYEAPREVVEILRRRFEGFFETEVLVNPDQEFRFEFLHLLRAAQIKNVFQELGYREIALGLSTIPEMTKILVLNRLIPEDKERVEFYLKRMPEGGGQRVKKAQVHLISKEVNPRQPDFFVKELGYLIYAKALQKQDEDTLTVLFRKMSRKEAAALEDAVRQYLPLNTEASVLPFREDVLLAVKAVLMAK